MHHSSHVGAPAGNWPGTLLIFFTLFVLIIGVLELFFRAQGHVPNINDSSNLWSAQRALVQTHAFDPKTTVLLGASRMQLGFDTAYFRQTYPQRPLINLAIDGSSPLAVLKDLSEDKDFNGTVLMSTVVQWMYKANLQDSQSYVDRYHQDYKSSIDRWLNTQITRGLQSHFVVLQHNLGIRSLFKAILKRQLPEPFYITTHPDRSRSADYTQIPDLAKHRYERIKRARERLESAPDPVYDTWRQDAQEVRRWVETIQARGGQVILLRLPTSGENWRMNEARYPRAVYWDSLGEITGAPILHFQDIEDMGALDLPDTSHIDQKDKREFTQKLIEALSTKGWID